MAATATTYTEKLTPTEQVDLEEQIASILFDDPAITISEEAAADAGRQILLAVVSRLRPDLITPRYLLVARRNGSSRSRRQRRFQTMDAITRGIERWRAAGFNVWWLYEWAEPANDYALVKQWVDGAAQ